MPVSGQILTRQSLLLQVKHFSTLEGTSNSGSVAPIAISYCQGRCHWPRRAECCTARPHLLELVEDAGLLRRRSAAGCYALEARRSWHVGIRFEGKSGHLEYVEVIGSIQFLDWLVAQLDCRKMVETGKSKGSSRLLALRSQNRNPRRNPLYTVHACHAMLGSPSLSVKIPRRQCSPSRAERSAAAARPRYRPILRSHTVTCSSAAINPTSLCTTIGRSQHHLSIVGEAVKS